MARESNAGEACKKVPKAGAVEKYERMLAFERKAYAAGHCLVAGIDEAGRGPLAGPVVAAACILDPARPVFGVDDSKKLSPAQRDRLFTAITESALCFGIGIVDPLEIDRINILQATIQAMRLAVTNLSLKPDLLLIDAIDLKGTGIAVQPIVKGDSLSASIAAASIIAKVTRDRLMDEQDICYPGYGFCHHKGYGTPEHYEALRALGLTPIHRRTFLRGL